VNVGQLLRALAFALLTGVFAPAAGAAADDATLRVAVQQEPAGLDPVIGARAIEADAFNLLFDGLFRTDDHGRMIPDLATRVPTRENGDISPDGRTITYHLVHNARWQDGPAVTSADVKFTYDAMMDARNNVLSRIPYDHVDRVLTPDPYTFVMHLRAPYVPAVSLAFLTGIAGSIVPAHLLKASADLNHDPFSTAPVGSGPYRLVAWNHGSDMVFEANPAYFRGVPKIKRILWRFIPDENAISSALRAHDTDLVDRLGLAPYAQLGSVPGLLPALGYSYLWEHLAFNTMHGPLADVRVRQALCDGMDIDELYAKVDHGVGDLGVGLQQPRAGWYDRSLQLCRFDPARARALLDAAGWHVGSDGIRTKNGQPLQITFGTIAGIIDRQQTQVLLQSRWHDLGVDTVLKTYPPSTFFAPAQAGGIMYSGKLDITMCAIPIPTNDPSRSEYETSGAIPPLGVNHAFWRDARVDALEFKGEQTADPATRKRIYDELQHIEAGAVPYVTLRWWTLIAMHDARLHGVRPPPLGSTYWNVNEWTF